MKRYLEMNRAERIMRRVRRVRRMGSKYYWVNAWENTSQGVYSLWLVFSNLHHIVRSEGDKHKQYRRSYGSHDYPEILSSDDPRDELLSFLADPDQAVDSRAGYNRYGLVTTSLCFEGRRREVRFSKRALRKRRAEMVVWREEERAASELRMAEMQAELARREMERMAGNALDAVETAKAEIAEGIARLNSGTGSGASQDQPKDRE